MLLAAIGALVGFLSDYDSIFPALGGPNGLFYDLTLKISQPWRRDIPTVPAAFVAIDDATLSRPEFAALPRALFQPIWARLIDGLLMSGARRIAFDVVLAYAGADFRVETFALPDYDQRLIESLQRGRDRIVLGRFPTQPVAPTFAKAVGTSRIGVLDLQVESDGRIRSTGAFVRLPDGRIVFGFAALAAGLSISQASSAQRLLIAPSAQLAETPAYSLGICSIASHRKRALITSGKRSKAGSSSSGPLSLAKMSTVAQRDFWVKPSTIRLVTVARHNTGSSIAGNPIVLRARCSNSRPSNQRLGLGP